MQRRKKNTELRAQQQQLPVHSSNLPAREPEANVPFRNKYRRPIHAILWHGGIEDFTAVLSKDTYRTHFSLAWREAQFPVVSPKRGRRREAAEISGEQKTALWTKELELGLDLDSRRLGRPVISLTHCLQMKFKRLSMNISAYELLHGELAFALLNKSLTLEAPTPTNISMNSEPDREKNGTPASPAMAFASNVLPVPGGPTRSTPLGILAPTAANFSGNFRNSTISLKSCFASSIPATSSNLSRQSRQLNSDPLNLVKSWNHDFSNSHSPVLEQIHLFHKSFIQKYSCFNDKQLAAVKNAVENLRF
ncbi:hypothetical protein IEQ34_019660 [Dendrobium chrysotoxum]|uniref:Uncharacterized protein n=1 Tax=Dendrobium chrysotoxum TaxID=161865 RepID=A0AAV7G7Z7_DENCH|nr:hypothetical protein IEQ34_019660 [Dendrobium chrysotoxum]